MHVAFSGYGSEPTQGLLYQDQDNDSMELIIELVTISSSAAPAAPLRWWEFRIRISSSWDIASLRGRRKYVLSV